MYYTYIILFFFLFHSFYCIPFIFFFFFQAEDGIRDAQESRGLGDVYKRQEIILGDGSKKVVGVVTSGCPSPTLGKNVAQCYLDRGIGKDTPVMLLVRGKEVEGSVVSLPFTTPRYYKIAE
eukprot:TRINITY_DN9655_c0_g1_i3.p1 TRINITY_DN9655_c0_g1~~TRINITY_DN9655_c0_g1_i3.p1  ORF type:complete len:121 (-),score=41.01 TRINITY_DN9655_c0_g1_i3:177-539(-)